MLKRLSKAAAAITAGLFLLTQTRAGKRRLDAAEPRRAEGRLQTAAAVAPDALARLGSLWLAQGVALCRVPALYASASGPARAQFSPVLRMRLQAPQRAEKPALVSFSVREELTLTAANDADLASSLAGPATPVRVLKAARIRPRRALLGAVEAALAA